MMVGRALMPDTIRTQVTVGHGCPTYGCYGDRGLRRTKQVGFPNPTNTETPVSPTVSDRHETVCRYKQYQIRGRVCAIGTHAAVGSCYKNSNACVACATHPCMLKPMYHSNQTGYLPLYAPWDFLTSVS